MKVSLSEQALNWVADHITFTDVIDLYFVISDLVDIPISETERGETAYYDELCNQTIDRAGNSHYQCPIGKLVL